MLIAAGAPHARDWIDILQALLTPVIALIALGIAFAQWWTARNRFRLDLFERRWTIYLVAREMLGEMMVQGRTSPEIDQRFLNGIRGTQWLLSEEMNRYLRKEVWSRASLLGGANMMLDPPAASVRAEDRQAAAKKRTEIVSWALAQDEKVDAMFHRFLQADRSVFSVFRKR
jgi:hypothetical protein